MGRLTNLIFNLQFEIPSLLHSVLKISISDFAFLRIYTLLICWEKLFNFLNSRGPQGSVDHKLRTADLHKTTDLSCHLLKTLQYLISQVTV
jgi:hypothetical protein